MIPIFKKEIRQFFSGLTGYLSMAVFLLLMGLFLFVFPETSLFEYGYATLDKFFDLAPWILLLLVPAITMRSFSEEFRSGTWELMRTRPVTLWQIIGGKFLAAIAVALLAVLPTLLYVITIRSLSINGSIDSGGIAGAYIGLALLIALFAAVGILCSTLTNNPVISFLLAAFGCFVLFAGFQSVSRMASLSGKAEYWIGSLGASWHYQNMSRGVLELHDVLYFLLVCALLLWAAFRVLAPRRPALKPVLSNE